MSERKPYLDGTQPTNPDVTVRTVVEHNGYKSNRIVAIFGRIRRRPLNNPVDVQPVLDQITAFTPDPKGRLPQRVAIDPNIML